MNEIVYFLKKSYTPEKRKVDQVENIFPYFVARPLSYFFSVFFIRFNITANTISKISIIVALSASLLLAFGDNDIKLIGCLFCFLWIVLDCVDGNLARYYLNHNKENVTPNGEFFDAASGYYFNAFVFLGIGVGVFLNDGFLPEEYSWLFIVIGALASIFSVLSRLIYQKFNNVCSSESNIIGNKGSRGFILALIQNLVALSNFFQVFLPLSIIFNILDYLLVFYFLMNLMMLLYISFKTKLIEV